MLSGSTQDGTEAGTVPAAGGTTTHGEVTTGEAMYGGATTGEAMRGEATTGEAMDAGRRPRSGAQERMLAIQLVQLELHDQPTM